MKGEPTDVGGFGVVIAGLLVRISVGNYSGDLLEIETVVLKKGNLERELKIKLTICFF